MNNPGLKNLGSVAIAAAVTSTVITEGVSDQGIAVAYIDGLEGMLACSLFCDFIYGSGGSSAVLVVQTTLDGTNWIDVACFAFTTSSARKVANLSGLTPKLVAAYAALSEDGVNDGLLGERLRAILTTTGTYAGNSSISIRAVCR